MRSILEHQRQETKQETETRVRLKNQMFVNNGYWKKIINEIILIKESDIKIDDSAILVGNGGSEPCLAGVEEDILDPESNQFVVRKAVSAGNIQVQNGKRKYFFV